MDRQTVIGILIFVALFLTALSFRYKIAGGAQAVHIVDGGLDVLGIARVGNVCRQQLLMRQIERLPCSCLANARRIRSIRRDGRL
jgi:hypothetical protein